MLRWPLRSLLLVAVFLAGVRFGQRTPIVEGTGPRGMTFMKKIRISSDREATVIFGAAEMVESIKPGYLRSLPSVQAIQGKDPRDWRVSFTAASSKKPWTVGTHFGDSAIQDYIRKRDRGFELIAQ